MEEERSKLGKSSWIMLGISVLALGIFVVVFMKLQSGHGEDVARCETKCKTMTKCQKQGSEGREPGPRGHVAKPSRGRDRTPSDALSRPPSPLLGWRSRRVRMRVAVRRTCTSRPRACAATGRQETR